MCASMEECFAVNVSSTDSSLEHQLVPRSIQRGASLWYDDVDDDDDDYDNNLKPAHPRRQRS